MAKNDKLINSLKAIAAKNREYHILAAAEKDTPQIYAAIAVALHRLLLLEDDDKAQAIRTIFAESQNIWFDCVEKGGDMVALCLDETGIDILGNDSKPSK